MRARGLSVHAGYRCRHSGACWSGVFPITAELARSLAHNFHSRLEWVSRQEMDKAVEVIVNLGRVVSSPA